MDSNRASSMGVKHTRDKEANLRTGQKCKVTWTLVKLVSWAPNLQWFRLLSKIWLLPTWWSWTCRWTTSCLTIRPNLVSTPIPRTLVSITNLLSFFSRPRRRRWVSTSYSIHSISNKQGYIWRNELAMSAFFSVCAPKSPNKPTWLNCGQNLFYDKTSTIVIWLF